jgi:histidinol-phosphate/aromatic aminotransferase/cobyric acid decarboxylase-like protein
MAGYGLPQCLRISVGDQSENQQLIAALDRAP